MRCVIQRVSSARVTVDGRVTGAINAGLLILLGIASGDTSADGEWLARKIAALRVFPDADGKMNRSVCETSGGVLIVSQFTLLASTRKGTRPSYNAAAPPDVARPIYDSFLAQMAAALGSEHPAGRVAGGEFGARMQVALVNDGPVTLIIDSRFRV